MNPENQIFLRYPTQRDAVFVLGAGASYPDNVPLQRDLLPLILSGVIPEVSRSSMGKEVIEFIADNFKFNIGKGEFPALEAIFGYMDYFIQQNESLNSKYTNLTVQTIKEHLIKLIHYVVDIQTDKKSSTYHSFWNSILKYNTNVSIVTLNYDTMLEQAFEFLFKKYGYIDYCTHFMNYDKIPELKKFNFWINPSEPVRVENGDNPVPFKIIKVHGSLNWKYCNCCNQVLLTPWDRKIDLDEGKFLGYSDTDNSVYEYSCPLDGTEFHTLIMPPSFLKPLSHPVLSSLMIEASREIRSTKKIVFVGYSLSEADIHIKALFKKHLNKDASVIVINKKKNEKFKMNYHSLSKNIEFYDSTFEEFVENEDLMREILLDS